jgi:hypothetical protein
MPAEWVKHVGIENSRQFFFAGHKIILPFGRPDRPWPYSVKFDSPDFGERGVI